MLEELPGEEGEAGGEHDDRAVGAHRDATDVVERVYGLSCLLRNHDEPPEVDAQPEVRRVLAGQWVLEAGGWRDGTELDAVAVTVGIELRVRRCGLLGAAREQRVSAVTVRQARSARKRRPSFAPASKAASTRAGNALIGSRSSSKGQLRSGSVIRIRGRSPESGVEGGGVGACGAVGAGAAISAGASVDALRAPVGS